MDRTLTRRQVLKAGAALVIAPLVATSPIRLPSLPEPQPPERDTWATMQEFADYLDSATTDDIRWFLHELNNVRASMAYFDRIGYRFYWYERASDADPKLWNKTGLIWTNSFADCERAATCGFTDRQLLEEWLDRIKMHVYEIVADMWDEIPAGWHPVFYRLDVPGGYLLDDELAA